MWMLNQRNCLVALLCALGSSINAAQEDIIVRLHISQYNYEKPQFPAPSVLYELRDVASYKPEVDPILRRPAKRPNSSSGGAYTYDKWPIRRADYLRMFAHFIIDAGPSYAPVNPFLTRVQLTREAADAGPIEQEIALAHRSNLAELYVRQVSQLTRSSNPSDEQISSAYNAAYNAALLEPTLKRFLQIPRVMRYALKTGKDISQAPLTENNLKALAGYDDLSFSDQWLLRIEILETLALAPDTAIEATSTSSIRDVAISFADEMLGSIDYDNPKQTSLPIVKIFLYLSHLQSTSLDCISLSENSERAITVSKNIDMGWPAQRTILLNWADCLEKMSRYGSFPTEERAILEISGNDLLEEIWIKFHNSTELVKDRLYIDTNASAERLRELSAFSGKFQEIETHGD